jgi:hypothetical protein
MLVCNISLRPPRRAIAADVAEITAAVDTLGTGNVVFATLVDDPASVGDIVDAYLGEIMLEAASATDSVSLVYVYDADVAEATTAGDSPSATVTGGTPTTWNPADLSGIALSGSNLIATSTGNFQGVRANKSVSSGKSYFELTIGTFSSGFVGMAKSTADLTSGGTTGAVGVNSSGGIEVNGSAAGISIGSIGGGIVGIAVDRSNNLIWFRRGASGSWNASSGTANDPATGTGGVSISTVTGALFPWFIAVFGGAGQAVTANFGAGGFAGTIPPGFSAIP